MASLLIGCGNSREKKIHYQGNSEWSGELVTIDMDPNCGASYVMDVGFELSKASDCGLSIRLLPFDDEQFDEIGAYDSMEHWGRQGDWRGWFAEMSEYHRILKPGGTMGVLVPIGPDAFADPGHTRFFQANHFHMLRQSWYEEQLAAGRPVTDYRWTWKKNFEIPFMQTYGGHHLAVVLEKA